jgi:hypothetical protein
MDSEAFVTYSMDAAGDMVYDARQLAHRPENERTLVFGLGVGVFLIFFFFMLTIIIWLCSIGCDRTPKIIARYLSVIVLLLVTLLLFFAPRTSRYTDLDITPVVYDESVPGRIAVGVISSIFMLGSILALIEGPLSDSFICSNFDIEPNTLWQEY